LTYQWQRCSDSGDPGTCVDVDGATDAAYVLVDPDDVGSYLRVVVTATNDSGTWSGTPAPDIAYQWERCSDSGDLGTCSDIEGAIDSTYLLVDPDDVAAFIRVVVTATNASGSDTSTSDVTAAVAATPAAPAGPTNTVAA